MEFAMWAYPWDLRDEGLGTAINSLQNIGISEVNVATNYHAVQTFNPRNPERRTWFSRASSYFQPSDRFDELAPVPNEEMGQDDWIDEIGAEFSDRSIDLNSWTIGCHNSRLGQQHPEYTLETPHGDSLVFGLCPSQEPVQRFLSNLISELSSRDWFNRIELETFDYFYGTGFGWHHDKYHTQLGELGEFLFGLCFCNACQKKAEEDGIAVDQVRHTCKCTIDELANGGLPHSVDPNDWLRSHEHVDNYIQSRTDTLRTVYADLCSQIGDSTDLGTYIGMTDVSEGWKHGLDFHTLDEHLDYLTVIAYEKDATSVIERVRTAQEFTDCELHAGIIPAHPEVYDERTTIEIVNALHQEGVERTSFYNYGLLPKPNLEWVRSAIREHV